MDTLLSARALMGLSLTFHTLFTPLGVGMPLLLFITEGTGLKTGNAAYSRLARAWTPVVGLLFAVGAVSGTVLSFELGLLWPKFMEYAGGIFGMPFSLEGFAFFTEAIFLAIYIYGWNRLSPRAHWLCGIPLFISAAISAVFVIAANAWMNEPEGFDIVNGAVANVDPWDAMFNAAWFHEALHGTLASYVTTGFAVAGVYAFLMLRNHRDAQSRLGLKVAMGMAAIAIPLQIIAGDIAAQAVANDQPAKFAAMEAQNVTERGAPLRIGGIPTADGTKYPIEIPKALSFLGFRDFNAEVTGLDTFPANERPNEAAVHLVFDIMVASGFAMLLIGIWFWWVVWRKRAAFDPGKWLLRAVALAGVLGFVAIEAGWFVTELGRQPWLVRGYFRTSAGVTDQGGIEVFFVLFTLLYIVILIGLGIALLRWPRAGRDRGDARGLGDARETGRPAPDVA